MTVRRVVISARKQMQKAKAVLTAEDPDAIRKIEALEKLIAERKQVSFRYVTSHVLWPYLPWLVPLYYQYQTRCGALTSTGAFFSDIVRTGAFPEIESVDPRVFGKWFVVARQLYDEGIHDRVEGYLRQREIKIRDARSKARKEGRRYTYDLAPKIEDEAPSVSVPQLEAVLRNFAASVTAPPPAPARAVAGAGEVVSVHSAQPAAREASPARATTNEEGGSPAVSPRTKTRDEMLQDRYEMLPEDLRQYVDTLPASERDKAINQHASEIITKRNVEAEKSERARLNAAALAKLSGGS